MKSEEGKPLMATEGGVELEGEGEERVGERLFGSGVGRRV